MTKQSQKQKLRIRFPAREIELDAKDLQWYKDETGEAFEICLADDIEWFLGDHFKNLQGYVDFYGSWRKNVEARKAEVAKKVADPGRDIDWEYKKEKVKEKLDNL